MSEQRFRKGDRVAWDTPQGKTTGRVVERLTGDKRVGNPGQKGTKVSASEEDPRYLVESDKTGKRAAHKAEALERRSA
jgi:Hypervirulence associated proteins TUDOR domain